MRSAAPCLLMLLGAVVAHAQDRCILGADERLCGAVLESNPWVTIAPVPPPKCPHGYLLVLLGSRLICARDFVEPE
jgi:hypothetical protein